jgi:sister chromatid cohesion protein PDS5
MYRLLPLYRHLKLLQDVMDTDEVDEWGPDVDVSWLTRAKLLSIKICRNRCIAHGGSGSALDLGNPVLTMLLTLLQHGGSMTEEARDEYAHPHQYSRSPLLTLLSPKVKSRMRLHASTSLVQLAAVPIYCDAIMPNFALVAVTLQVRPSCFDAGCCSKSYKDPCFQVRMGFLAKLITYLTRNKTDLRFNAVVFLTAHDPEREVREKVSISMVLF